MFKRGKCIDVDECTEFPHLCRGNIHCSNTVGSYSCGCWRGFELFGTNCTGGLEIFRGFSVRIFLIPVLILTSATARLCVQTMLFVTTLMEALIVSVKTVSRGVFARTSMSAQKPRLPKKQRVNWFLIHDSKQVVKKVFLDSLVRISKSHTSKLFLG